MCLTKLALVQEELPQKLIFLKQSLQSKPIPSRINTLWEKDGDTTEMFTPTACDICHIHFTKCREKQATVAKSTTAKTIGPETSLIM